MVQQKHEEVIRIERDEWKSKSQFLLACVGYAVGLGNIWRFPYLCFKSGGGAFIIPYLTMLVLCGIPLLYLEMAIGQYTRYGPVHALEMICPLMKGVGLATVVISFILCTYYNVVITWALYYFFNSFNANLPWQSCNETWSSPNCSVSSNNTANNLTVSSTQDFFDQVVLKKTEGIHNMGNMQWKVFGCFVLAWVLCYLCISRGIKSVGKVVYATATFPYLILIILLVVGCTLPGARSGVIYFIKPVWSELLNVEVWVNAAAQNFNSIGIAFGSLIAFSSYNHRDNNILRDTLCIACINSGTSLLAGFVIFSAMGHMAHVLGKEVAQVATEGPELVFIVYPQIFSNLPVPQLWSAIFFLMLVCMGIDSQFAMIEVVNTTLSDVWDGKLLTKYFKRKELLALFVCVIAFLIGIPNLMQGGIYVFTLLDNYTAIVSLMFLAFFEVVAICWIFGGRRVAKCVKEMTGTAPSMFFVVCWVVCAPLLIGIILIFSIVKYKPAHYGSYVYPAWADGLGWFVALCSMLCVPIGALVTILSLKGSFWERLKQSITPRLKTDEFDDDVVKSVSSKESDSPPPYATETATFLSNSTKV
ncbi:sodium- and chloride-dependent GABA transporter ine [Ciona intestinalis]